MNISEKPSASSVPNPNADKNFSSLGKRKSNEEVRKRVSFNGIDTEIVDKSTKVDQQGSNKISQEKNYSYPTSDMRHYAPPPPLSEQQRRMRDFVPFQKIIEEHPELDPNREVPPRTISWENPEEFSN